jgi:hypothetical protein
MTSYEENSMNISKGNLILQAGAAGDADLKQYPMDKPFKVTKPVKSPKGSVTPVKHPKSPKLSLGKSRKTPTLKASNVTPIKTSGATSAGYKFPSLSSGSTTVGLNDL